MNRNEYNGYDSHGRPHQEGVAGKADVRDAIQHGTDEAIRRIEESDGSTITVAGMTIDKGIADAFTGFYTAAGGEITKRLSPKTYDTVMEYAPKLKLSGKHLEGKALNRTAAGVTLGVNLGVLLLPSITKFVSDVRDQFHQRTQVARLLAPVLDDLKGKHSVGAYNSVTVEENSVIWAHRQRMRQETNAINQSTVMGALGNNILNIARESLNLQALMSGDPRQDVFLKKYKKEAGKIREEIQHKENYNRRGPKLKGEALSAHKEEVEQEVYEELRQRRERDFDTGQLGLFGINFSLPMLLKKLTDSSLKRLERSRQPYSALEMIFCLSEQMQNNTGSSDRFQLPGKHGRELPIGEYISEIFKQHQLEMSDLKSKHTRLRESLHEDLDQLLQPVTEAVRSGKLNPLMLAHLVGEHKVIKAKGLGLASAAEVEKALAVYTGKSHRLNTKDPKEFLSEQNFSLEHVKDSLSGLVGDEKLDFAAAFPDGVLKAAGMTEKEIKAVQMHRVQEGHKQLMMYGALGLGEKKDEALKADGLGSAQIKHLREAVGAIEADGIQALDGLLSNPTHTDGLERVVIDAVVPRLAVGDKTYLGKLVEQGRKAEKNKAPAADEAQAGEMADGAITKAQKSSAKHVARLKKDREAQAEEADLSY